MMAPWLCTTAFGAAVVPDVYDVTIGSLACTCASTAASNSTETGATDHGSIAHDGASGPSHHTDRRSGCDARYAGSSGARSSIPGTAAASNAAVSPPPDCAPTTATAASECASAYPTSGARENGLSRIACAPMRVMARYVTTQSALFANTIATREF